MKEIRQAKMETKLTKIEIFQLFDAINYMKPQDWYKYSENGSRKIPKEEARKRYANLLKKLHKMKEECFIVNEDSLHTMKEDVMQVNGLDVEYPKLEE